MGIGPADQKPPDLPTVPQRWVFTLARKAGVKTIEGHGMSTFRCPSCNAALTDSDSPSCDYCGTLLNDGARDWVLAEASPYEYWHAESSMPSQQPSPAARAADQIMDRQERERLLYMMAAMAAADGIVDGREQKLLRLCAERWSVPWDNVAMALRAGPELFDRLLRKGSPEAEVFLQAIVNMALVDGRIDRKERRMLQAAAEHLGMTGRLEQLLNGR